VCRASLEDGRENCPGAAQETGRSPIIYSVWRLDAATPALAKGLVDKALLAESKWARRGILGPTKGELTYVAKKDL